MRDRRRSRPPAGTCTNPEKVHCPEDGCARECIAGDSSGGARAGFISRASCLRFTRGSKWNAFSAEVAVPGYGLNVSSWDIVTSVPAVSKSRRSRWSPRVRRRSRRHHQPPRASRRRLLLRLQPNRDTQSPNWRQRRSSPLRQTLRRHHRLRHLHRQLHYQPLRRPNRLRVRVPLPTQNATRSPNWHRPHRQPAHRLRRPARWRPLQRRRCPR